MAHSAESDAGREADLLIEVGHPSRPDREELMRQHVERIRHRARDEALQDAMNDIKARIATFNRLAADQQYINALHDAWGLVANRQRDAIRARVTPPGQSAQPHE